MSEKYIQVNATRKDRNYWLALIGCIVCTVLALMGKDGMDNLKWYLLSDLNVALWLLVAWLFDNKEPVITITQSKDKD